ncbi:membrane dipeptidase [Aureibaculum algae]|uniref:Membrane dipeptidase n=1 Tax=Aureibaculum algae TaxID=2584122 RepID=A0A5B7TPZ0_9FLAO|nr:dipeptidase [Aureibaculum algae]QCX38310.1 membrane dipeptidase [Aureibaculum algae]
MRYLVVLFFIFVSCKQSPENKRGPKTLAEIHNQAIFVDTHNDILLHTMEKGFIIDDDLTGKTHSDLNRMKQGGLDVQFFSVWSDGNQANPYQYANAQMDSLDAVIIRNPTKIVKVATTEELLKVVQQDKIAALIGLEGGHQFENDIHKLDTLFNRGVRYITLTWNNSTSWATSASDESKKDGTLNSEGEKGLTELGKQIVHKMNTLGIMVDISHVGEQTFWDVIATTTKPIIASHSSVYTICPHPRNLKDDQIKAIAKNGGVIQINFNSGFIDATVAKKEEKFLVKHKTEIDSLKQLGINPYVAEESMYSKYHLETEELKAPFHLVIDHIEYIIKLVGVDYVGIGSDFDGIVLPPKQLDDVTTYPLITKALIERGYNEKDIYKILGGNILRVLKANE